MRVVVVGSGGREHALAVVLGRDHDVIVTPGNPGIAQSVDVAPTDLEADLFVVGPEAPLVDGLADRLRARGRRVFGPGADGAHLEASKAWMKQLLVTAGVPTATHDVVTDLDAARRALTARRPPYVVKTDGLAAGKGVLVTDSLAEAVEAAGEYLSGRAFGDAGRTVVIEEGLIGPELSILAICDGTRAVPLAPAQDFKRLADGDKGPNTGGMGAFSPVPFADADVVATVMDCAVEPTLAALRAEGIDYRGVLYAGLMLTDDGPRVLEYNVRFGDPEAQVVLPRLRSDLGELLASAADGRLGSDPVFGDDAAVTVVAAAPGYPALPRTGDVIEGVDESGQLIDGLDDVQIFYAGVGRAADGRLATAGGRVLAVTGSGPTIAVARERAYDGAGRVSWPGIQRRGDIASGVVR